MTNCTSSSLEFPACRKRRVAADFSGGDITSNGGVLLLRQADRLSGLTASVARRLIDARQRGKVEHRFVAMLRQRVFGLALGYEDVQRPLGPSLRSRLADGGRARLRPGQPVDAEPLRERRRPGLGVEHPRGSGGGLHRVAFRGPRGTDPRLRRHRRRGARAPGWPLLPRLLRSLLFVG